MCDERLSCLAFVDDLLLLASTPRGLQTRLKTTELFFAKVRDAVDHGEVGDYNNSTYTIISEKCVLIQTVSFEVRAGR